MYIVKWYGAYKMSAHELFEPI